MSDYVSTLKSDQIANMKVVVSRMKAKGITNLFTQAAILAVCSKESGFRPQREKDWSNTGIAQIRKIFPKHPIVSKMSDAELNVLKKDSVKWFNTLYGGKNGNRPGSNDGFDFRGGGFNQITFRRTYEKIGKEIGVDLVKNPEKLNEVEIAADALIQYFVNFFKVAPQKTLAVYNGKGYGLVGLNSFTKLEDAVNACYHANAGWGRTLAYIQRDHTGGRKKALGRSESILTFVKSLS